MTAPELLATLRARGVRVRVAGDHLRLAPADALSAELLEETRRLKRELLRLLAPEFSTSAVCGWCAGPFAPYLLDVAGRPALLCPSCRRWTLTGGAS